MNGFIRRFGFIHIFLNFIHNLWIRFKLSEHKILFNNSSNVASIQHIKVFSFGEDLDGAIILNITFYFLNDFE
jgi:hypothetical protein